MSSSIRSLKLVAVCAAVLGLMSIGASAASAAPAEFKSPPAGFFGNSKISGTVTATLGLQTTSCTFSGVPAGARNEGGQGRLISLWEFPATCTNGGKLGISLVASAQKSGTSFSISQAPGQPGMDPFPGGEVTFKGVAFEVPWTNGAGATASKITFNKTLVSYEGMLLTGSLNVTRADGSLLVLQ